MLRNKCDLGVSGLTLVQEKSSPHTGKERWRLQAPSISHRFCGPWQWQGYDNISIRSDGKCVASTLLTVLQVWDQHTVAESNACCHPLNVYSSAATQPLLLHTAKVIWPDWYQNILINHSFQLHRGRAGREILRDAGSGEASVGIMHTAVSALCYGHWCTASLQVCPAALNWWHLSPLIWKSYVWIAFLQSDWYSKLLACL